MSRPPELRALTGMRGIAAWAVVVFHLLPVLPPMPAGLTGAIRHFYLAVDFFFLLSGFVIWLAWHDRFDDGGWRAVPRFLVRRVARLLPLHLATLLPLVALAALLAALGRSDAALVWEGLPLHLLLVQAWGSDTALAWNAPAWSISAELAVNLLFPAMVFAVDWRRVPVPAILAAGVALLALLAATFAVEGVGALGDQVPRMAVRRCALEFAVGTAVAALWLRWRSRPALPALAAAGIALAAFGARWAGAPEPATIPIAFAALLLLLAFSAGRRGNPLEGRTLHWLGEVSFATYLSHYMLWKLFKLAFVSDIGAVGPMQLAAYAGIVLVASHLLFHRLERPAQRWLEARLLPPHGARRLAGSLR